MKNIPDRGSSMCQGPVADGRTVPVKLKSGEHGMGSMVQTEASQQDRGQ